MGKNNRFGKAAVLTATDISRLRTALKYGPYRCIFEIGIYTGERWGAILQLETSAVFEPTGSCLQSITFKKHTRKASPQGERLTRQIPVHPRLKEFLESYPHQNLFLLFPSPHNPLNPISMASADRALRIACEKAGLGGRGISTHSTRRSFATNLSKAGISIETIQAMTGHKSLESLRRYIQTDEETINKALATLS